jgi:hypothetical protein
MRREVKPEPVPPPKEWKMRKPCRPEHCSDCFLRLGRKKTFLAILELLLVKKHEDGDIWKF